MGITFWYRALSWPQSSKTLPVALLVFLVVSLWMPPTGVWGDNEQHYLWLARQWVGFEGVPANSALLGGMPHAYAFLSVAGAILGVFGEEAGHVALRLITAAFYAYAIARLALSFELRAIEAGFLVIAFVLLDQGLFAGEWLIGGVEPKTFAYPCVLLALSELVERRYMRCAMWLGAASHFHLILGGLWATFVFLAALADERRPQPLIRPALGYGLLVLPFALYVRHVYASNGASADGTIPSAAYILTVIRSPHHSAPWFSLQTVIEWMPGIVVLMPILWSAAFLSALISGHHQRMLARLISISSSFLVLALVGSYWDIHGAFASLTPFRVSSLTLLLALGLVLTTLRQIASEQRVLLVVPMFVVLGSAYAVTAVVYQLASPIVAEQRHTQRFAGLWQFARDATPASSVFLADSALERATWDFERRTSRALLVVWKFIPGPSSDVQEWYRRERFRAAVFKEGCSSQWTYDVNYLIVLQEDAERFSACGNVAFSDQDVALVKLRLNRRYPQAEP